MLVLVSRRTIRAGLSFVVGWIVALAVATGVVVALTDAVAEDGGDAARDGVDIVKLAVGEAVVVVGPERSAPALEALEQWLLSNLNTILVVLLTMLASVMIGQGLDLFR